MQTTLLSFAIGLILALLAALIGPHFVNWNDHRAFFEKEASRLVGVPVKVGGDIEAGILPFPSVTLNVISVGSRGQTSRLKAKSLRIELALGPLMRGELRATEMKLVAPQFSAGLDNQGRVDWPPLALADDAFSIDHLSIEDGHAALTDANTGAVLELDQLWFAGSVGSLSGPVRGKGEFVANGGLYGYAVSASRSGANAVRLKLSLNTEERPLAIEADGQLTFDQAAPRFDGALSLSRPAVAELAGGKAGSEPWRLTSKVKADESSATLDDVAFQYGPDERAVSLTGSAELKFGDKPQIEGSLTARQVDLDRLLATADMPRRLPLSAIQAFGELLGGALRPSWPVRLAVRIDAMTLGGGAIQNVASDLRSNGDTWTLDRLEFRAPGFAKVKVDGRLFPLGAGLGFAGGLSVEANDPKNLLAWLSGQPAVAAQYRPWRAQGDVTLGSDRIAVDHLQTEIDRGSIEGSVSYAWPIGSHPARLDADLRAADLDLDNVFGVGRATLGGLGLQWPGEIALALEIGHARVGGLDAKNIAAKFSLDAGGLAIDRLSIEDLGNTGIMATGRIRTLSSPGGSIVAYLDARDLNGLLGVTDKFAPALATPLRRLAAGQKTAVLRATIGVDDSSAGAINGKLELEGQIGALRINASATAAAKRDALTLTNLAALSGTQVQFNSELSADESGPLLELLGLGRVVAAGHTPARLQVSANGPLNRDLRLDGRLAAGPIDLNGLGTLRLGSEQPASLSIDQFAGSIAGDKVQGRLVLGFGDQPRIDGVIEAEELDAATAVAASIGQSAQNKANGGGWSSDPIVWNPPGVGGHIEVKALHATLLPGVVAQNFSGQVRFNPSEVVFENIAGDIGKGRLDGRLAIAKGDNGVTARLRVALTGAEAGALFAGAEPPPATGRLNFQAEIEGTGRSPAAFAGSLTGFGSVTLEQAQIVGLNPDVFGAVTRAVELGIPIEGNRIREFVSGALENASLPVAKASATISVNAGQARLRDIAIKSDRADVQATVNVNVADGSLDALLTLNGLASAPGAARPAVLVALTGPLRSPKRTIDTGLLTSWLTLRAVDQKSKELHALEQARRESSASPQRSADPPNAPAPTASTSVAPEPRVQTTSEADATSEDRAGSPAPALPPPVIIAPAPKPLSAPKLESAAPNAGAAPRAPRVERSPYLRNQAPL